MAATAADTSGNSERGPQWKSSGWSARIRNWLKVKPSGGATSGRWVDRRKIPEAISSALVSMCASKQEPAPELMPYCQVRSAEHTSELQSLMRISYAVFCLKKNKKQQ